MAKSTTAQLIVKQLQYVEETTEGTMPTASPTFNEIGKIASLTFNRDNSEVDVMQVGPEDLYGLVQGKTVSGFKIKFAMFGSTFLKYCLNAANYGTPAGTISAPLSMIFSLYINGTENFIKFLGCRCVNVTIDGDISTATMVTAEFKCIQVTEPNSSNGLTTPTFITPSTAAVYDWLAAGSSPITWNSAAINAVKISVSVNRNTAEDWTLGNATPFTIQPHGRRVAFTLTQLWTDTTLSADQNTATQRTLVWTLKTSGPAITITNGLLDKQSQDIAADQTTSLYQVFNGKATSITTT